MRPIQRRSWKQIALIFGLGLVGLIVIVSIIGYFVLSFYVSSDGFRDQLAKVSARALKVDQVKMEPLNFSGSELGTQSFKATGSGLLQELTVEQLDSVLDRGSLFDRHFKVQELKAEHVVVQLKRAKKQGEIKTQIQVTPAQGQEIAVAEEPSADVVAEVSQQPVEAKKKERKKSWLQTHVFPEKYSLGTGDIKSLFFTYDDRGRIYGLDGVKVHITPEMGNQEYRATLSGGKMILPWKLLTDSTLEQATVRYRAGRVNTTDCRITSSHGGLIDLEGEWEETDSRWWVSGVVRNLSCKSLLPDDWIKRVEGTAQGTVRAQGEQGRLRDLSGTIQLNKAVLTGLPVLDTLAAFTGTSRFRRIEFNDAKAKFDTVDGVIHVTDIVLASDGLVRVEGELQVNEKDELSGRLRVGVVPGLLSLIPGAEEKVFSAENNGGKLGLLWCNVNLSGTLNSPREDLSARLIAAAKDRLFRELPSGKKALQIPGAIIGTLLGGGSEKADSEGTSSENNQTQPEQTDKKKRKVERVLDMFLR